MPDETSGFEPDRTMSDEGWGTDKDLASLPGGPPDAALLDRIAEMAGIGEDSALPSEPMMDLLETAWGIIANAGWDDCAMTPGWQEAAVRWRDRYHVVLRAFCEGRPAESLPDGGMADPPTHYTPDADTNLAGDITIACGALHWALVTSARNRVTCEACVTALRTAAEVTP